MEYSGHFLSSSFGCRFRPMASSSLRNSRSISNWCWCRSSIAMLLTTCLLRWRVTNGLLVDIVNDMLSAASTNLLNSEPTRNSSRLYWLRTASFLVHCFWQAANSAIKIWRFWESKLTSCSSILCTTLSELWERREANDELSLWLPAASSSEQMIASFSFKDYFRLEISYDACCTNSTESLWLRSTPENTSPAGELMGSKCDLTRDSRNLIVLDCYSISSSFMNRTCTCSDLQDSSSSNKNEIWPISFSTWRLDKLRS